MNCIKLKIFVVFLLIHLINRICCETNTLEDKYETGKEILLSISINIMYNNVTSFFIKIQKKYDNLLNIFKDGNDKSIMNFIELSKKQIVSEVNIQANNLNRISLDEQSKYEDFIRKNIQGFKGEIPTADNCFKNNDPLNKILRCIDQYQNSTNKFSTIDNIYSNTKYAINIYNSILISKIKVAENNFIATINETMSTEKIINDKFIKTKSSISIPSTSSTNKKNQNLSLLSSRTNVNDTLKNLYVNHTRWLNSVDFKNWIAIQSISLNLTLNHISKINNINDDDKKNVQCCFDYSKLQLAKLKSLAVNENDECIENELFHLNNLILLNLKDNKTRKLFNNCFENNILPESIVECMGWINPFNSSPLLKIIYNENVAKLNSNKRFSFARIYQCFYDSRDYFDQRLRYLNNQFNTCIVNEGFFIGCIDPDNAYNFKPTSLLLSPETSQSVSHIVYS